MQRVIVQLQWGGNSTASGEFAMAFGNNAFALSEGAISLGAESSVAKDSIRGIAIGIQADVRSKKGVAVGNTAYVAANSDSGLALGDDSNAKAVKAISIGPTTSVSSANALALGSNITIANGFDESVAIGSDSAVRKATNETTATVNGFTYNGFAGATKINEPNLPNVSRVFSVGNANYTRQIINVAPGKIASNSTDAINGSQLYLLADTVGNLAKATAAHLGGYAAVANNNITAPTYNIYNALANGGNNVQSPFTQAPANNVGDAITNLNAYVNQGFNVSDHDNTKKGVVTPGDTIQFINGQNTKANVTAEANGVTKITFDVDLTGIGAPNIEQVDLVVADGKVTPPQQGDEGKFVTAGNVAQAINNTFWKTGKLKETKDVVFTEDNEDEVKAGDNVRFADGNFTKVSVGKKANDDTLTAFKVDVDAQKVVEAAQLPVVYTDKDGNKVVKSGDKFLQLDPDGNVTTNDVKPEDVIASLNNGKDKTNAPMTLANLKGNLKRVDKDGNVTDPTDEASVPPVAVVPDLTKAPELPNAFDETKQGYNPAILNNAATMGDVLNAGWNLQGNGIAKDFVKPFDTVNFADGLGTTVEIDVTEAGKLSTIKVNTLMQATDEKGNPLVRSPKDGKYYPNGTTFDAAGDPENGATPVTNPVVSMVNVNDKAPQLSNVAAGANIIADKLGPDNKALVKVGDKFYAQDQFADGKLIDGAQDTDPNAATPATEPADKAKAGLLDLVNSNPTNAMTVADAKNLGWVVSADKEEGKDTPYASAVRNATEVKFTGKNGIEVVGSDKGDVREIAISLKEGEVTPADEFVQPTGNVVVKINDQYYDKDDIDPTTGLPKDGIQPLPLTPDDISALVNNGKYFVTGNKVAEAIQKSGWNIGLANIAEADKAFADNAKLLSDTQLEKVNPNDNVRFTNGKGITAKIATVKKFDENGDVVTDTFMKFDVDLPITYTAEDDDGNKLVKANDGKWYVPDDVNADGSVKDSATATEKTPKEGTVGAKLTNNQPNAKDYEVKDPIILGMVDFLKNNPNATAEDIAVERDRLVDANPEAKDKPVKGEGGVNLNNVAWAEKPDQAVNKDQLDQTVNKSGFFVKENGKSTLVANADATEDDKTEKVTPNDVVDFVDGINTNVKVETTREAGRDVTKVRVDVTGLPVTYTDKDGNKVAKAPDGSYYKVDPDTGVPKVLPDGTPDPDSKVETGDVIASMVNPDGDNTKDAPLTLSNVAAGANTIADKLGPDGKPLVKVGDKLYTQDQFVDGKLKPDATEADPATLTEVKDPVDKAKAGLADLVNSNPTNALTVADAKNLGWVVSADKEEGKDTPYAADVRNTTEVKFTGGDGIDVTGETKENVREIKISLKKGEVIKTNDEEPVLVNDDGSETPVIKVGDQYFKKDDLDPNTGLPTPNATPLTSDEVAKVENKRKDGAGFVTGNQVADAIQDSGWTVGKAKADEVNATKFDNNNGEAEKVNPNDNVRFADGKNTVASLGTVKAVDENGVITTTTTVKVDVDSPIDFKYTNAEGKEYVKANDGKFYEKDAVNPDGTLVDPAANPPALDDAEVAKLKKGAQLTNGINDDGVKNAPYEAKDPIQLAVQKAVADTLAAKPDADPEEIAAAVAVAKAEAIKANPEAKDTIKAGEGGVNLNNVAWATEPDQAVNKDQLDQTVNKSGFFVKQNGKSTLAVNTDATEDDKTEKVTPNDVVNFVNGGNTVAKAETKRDETTGQDITEVSYNLTGLPITYTAKDGTPVVKVGDKFFKVDPDGTPSKTEVSVDQLSTNLVNPAAAPDKIGAPTVLGNVASGTNTIANKVGDDGKPLVQVGEGADAKFYAADQFENGVLKSDAQEVADTSKPVTTAVDKAKAGLADLDNSNPTNAVNVADVKKLGFVIATKDNDYAGDVRNGNVVEFVSDNDLATVKGVTRDDGVREVRIAITKDPIFNTVQVGGSTGPKLSVTKEGDLNLSKPDGSPVRIRNVAKGVDPNDAVNVGQLRDAVDDAVNVKFGDINGKIGKVDKNMRAGVAGANAAAGLPQVYIHGKSMVAAAVSTYKGQSAIAVGYSRASDNGKVILKLQGNANTQGDFAGSVGVGYQW
ncbi:YadA-like family protein [Bisgaard Taxon 46]